MPILFSLEILTAKSAINMSVKSFSQTPRQYLSKICINLTLKKNKITPMLSDNVSFFTKTNVPREV